MLVPSAAALLPHAVPFVDPEDYRAVPIEAPAWHGALVWLAVVVALVVVGVVAGWAVRRRSLALTLPAPDLRRGLVLLLSAAVVVGGLSAASTILGDEAYRESHGDGYEREHIAEQAALVALQEHYGVNLVHPDGGDAWLPSYPDDPEPVRYVTADGELRGGCEIAVRGAEYTLLCGGQEFSPQVLLAGVPQTFTLMDRGSLLPTHLLTVAKNVGTALAIVMTILFAWGSLGVRPRDIESEPDMVALAEKIEAQWAEAGDATPSAASLEGLVAEYEARVRAAQRPYRRAAIGILAGFVASVAAFCAAVWASDEYGTDPPWAYDVGVAENGLVAEVADYYGRAPLDGFSPELVTSEAVTGSIWKHPAGTHDGAECFFVRRSAFVLVECETSPHPTLVRAAPN
ncbi:hypothetical protein GCM10011331_08480 [Flavimobilis marinus]|uniref:Uncharacterized protein n=1 Tax=Flavimobilis marinus TaxID=285351 RepID=A0A1I2CIE2_9MICO|nr:hypothetical protein [Flavimobilis marinus]GHG47555.1 hypothetical protein GCM10011331_08480 [Flavimobilis marinus]SFE68107.1 hypothetical protein SAMN04488035_0141 [Flavimobilis marinus]